MKVVYLSACAQWGGAETSLRQLLASLRVAQPDCELWLVLGEDGPLAALARELGVHVAIQAFPEKLRQLGDAGGLRGAWRLVAAVGPTTAYSLRLRDWLRKVQPDIVHTNGFKMHLLGAWSRPPETPLVWHIHDYVSSRPLMSRLLGAFQKACKVAIVNSRSVADDMGRLFPATETVPIYNAIDLERFSKTGKRLDLDAVGGLSPAAADTIRVGLVATFARWKGHKVFLNAMAQLPHSIPIRGYVIGGPIYSTHGSQWSMEELRAEADRLGLAGKVGFTGHIDDPAEAMRSLDIVVHASTQAEPFGMVIIEAMACEKAIIASSAGGACELFEEEENALSHRPGDAAGLARQIVRLARDPALRLRLGAKGRATAEQRYTGQRMAREVLDVYQKIRRDRRLPGGVARRVPIASE